MTDELKKPGNLNAGAQKISERAAEIQRQYAHAQAGAYHWLLALIEKYGPMAESLSTNLSAAELRAWLAAKLKQGECGPTVEPQTLINQALDGAQARGKDDATEKDLARAIIAAAGYTLRPEDGATLPTTMANPSGDAAPATTAPSADQPPMIAGYSARVTRPTPTLDKFGTDLTKRAAEGKLYPTIGRAQEIDLVIETLCRRVKRNPLLVGPAGVGKTAIAEGLAQLIAKGEVPQALKGVRLIGIQPSMLVAGAGHVGEIEQRVQALLSEAMQDGIVLFVDEVHTMIGAGGMPGSGDIASLVKPSLARGDWACIAATTDAEWRNFIEPDAALERRFQVIRVQEMTAEQSFTILQSLRDGVLAQRGVAFGDDVLAWLVDFARRYLHNRYFPDKAVDLFEQCLAHAVKLDKTAVDLTDAEDVAQRMVGMPIQPEVRLEALKAQAGVTGLLSAEQLDALERRLAVTLRGLDIRAERPNAVLILGGPAADNAGVLARACAGALYGSPERIVDIDFSRMNDEHDMSMLIGSPPGYVGYGQPLPLHKLVQMPWAVVLAHGLDQCHPNVRALFTQGLKNGFVTDAQGKRIYLSDCVVVITSGAQSSESRAIGFLRDAPAEQEQGELEALRKALGAELVELADVVITHAANSAPALRSWLKGHLLPELASRYLQQGLKLSFDEPVVDWLIKQNKASEDAAHMDRFLDDTLGPLLIEHLSGFSGQPVALKVQVKENKLAILQPG